ncbi:MAG: coproporphyrinogen III oxidase, partial [uncultured bacterium]
MLKTKVEMYFKNLQSNLCAALETQEPSTNQFTQDHWQHHQITGCSRVLIGKTFEKAGVNFSTIKGDTLPLAATEKRVDLLGAAFEAMGVSSVIHPVNPFVPTAHMNVRYFQATKKDGGIVWWFGGGFDLTP